MTIANVSAAAAGATIAAPTPAGSVRSRGSAGGPSDAATVAEGFERLMLAQLSAALIDTAMPAGGAEGAPAGYRELLPDALTEALMSAGGIGLATTLEESLR